MTIATIDVSTEYKPSRKNKLMIVDPLDETIKVTFSNPSTIVIYHSVDVEKEIDLAKDDFERALKKVARPSPEGGKEK